MILISNINKNLSIIPFIFAPEPKTISVMITMSEKRKSVDEKLTLNLIRGEFTAGEAVDLLSELFQSKIDFHVAQNFSHEERLGVAKSEAIQRIMELKNAKKESLDLVKGSGKKFRIHSNVIIEPLNQNA
ncbi:hypothetical protein [Jiulongibacter sediminis]|uniref:hypothetical protein n=1 Tax=Jiulongibacter sediminis TaxID=1605367 RepID=UPI0026E9281F|nr:hypothetical protein [Jiulongibacter sediminis]